MRSEPYKPTNAERVPRKTDLALERLLGYERSRIVAFLDTGGMFLRRHRKTVGKHAYAYDYWTLCEGE